jgi:flagellar motor switch protein FliM
LKHQLSQQEIDSYFQKPGSSKDADSVARFDFRRLDRISKSQVSAIHHLHETFVRALISSLSVYLRSFVSGSLVSVDQLPYSDFAEALPSPTCLAFLGMQPYEGHTLIEVAPSLISPILDLLLGGDGKAQSDPDRELTEVEQNLIEGFFQIVVHDLREIWKPVVAVNFTIGSIETSPQMSGRFVPTEAVVVIAIELRIGDNVGTINVAFPSITLKMMGQRFDQQWTAHKTENPATELAIKQKLAENLRVTVDCEVSGLSIRLQDLLSLSPGEVYAGPSALDGRLDILVNGRPKFKATLASEANRRVAVIE